MESGSFHVYGDNWYNTDMSTNELVKDPVAITLQDLSPAHQAFINAILQYKNQTRAYMDAYPGTSYESASSSATNLLRDPGIISVINTLLDKRAMQANEVIDRQGSLARINLGDIIEIKTEPALDRHGELLKDPEGNVVYRQITLLKEGALDKYGYLIKSIKPANRGGLDIEVHSVQDALSAMARIRRLIQDIPPALNIENVHIYLPDNSRDNGHPGDIIDATASDLDDQTTK
jgi:hypothetical protein